MSNASHRDRAGSEPPLDCSETRELLVPWLDEELPPNEAQRVSGHVGQCSACARELEQHRRVGSTLDAVYAARPAIRDVLPQVRRRLERERRTDSPLDSSRRTLRRVVLGVAASVLVAVGAWWLVTIQSPPPDGDQDPSVAIEDVPAEDGLLENLDVLEALEEEGVDLTPELVQSLLDDDVDDELEGIFEYVLEEEVFLDQL